MNKAQYKLFRKLYDDLHNKYPKNQNVADNFALDDIFGNEEIEFGDEKIKIADYLRLLYNAGDYAKIPPYFIEHAELNGYFDGILGKLEAVSDSLDNQANKVLNTGDEENKDIDGQFLSRVLAGFNHAETVSNTDSQSYKALKAGLETFIKNRNEGYYSPDKKDYLEAFLNDMKDLDSLANAYLEHKITGSMNYKSIEKVNGAMALKQFITEKREQIFRDKMIQDTEDAYAEYKKKWAATGERSYEKKLTEIANTRDVLLDLADGGDLDMYLNIHEDFFDNLLRPVLQDFNFPSERNFNDFDKENPKEFEQLRINVACIMVHDLMRNELLAGGGKITPLLQKLVDDPYTFIRGFRDSQACRDLCEDEDALIKYVQTDVRTNVINTCLKGLPEIENFVTSPQLADSSLLLTREARGEAYLASPDIAAEYNAPVNLAKAYLNLAKYAKDSLDAKNGKEAESGSKAENDTEAESGLDAKIAQEKYVAYTNLAKEQMTKADEQLNNLRANPQIPALNDINIDYPQKFTKEQKLAYIKEVNKDIQAAYEMAGITPPRLMTDEEMEALAADESREKEYEDKFQVATDLRDGYNQGARSRYKVPKFLERSRQYLFKTEKTPEDVQENKAMEDRLNNPVELRKFMRGVFDKIMALDETKLYLENIEDKANLFREDMKFYQMLFEYEHISRDGQAAYEFFTPEEVEQIEEKLNVLANPVIYESELQALGRHFHLFYPDMTRETGDLLWVYYGTIGQEAKRNYIKKYTESHMLKESQKYGETAMKILKENGFAGHSPKGLTYRSFDDKGRFIATGRARGIEDVLEGKMDFVRIEKTTKNGDETATHTFIIDKEMVVRRYCHEKMEEHLAVEDQRLQGVEFSKDEHIREIQRAVIHDRLLHSRYQKEDVPDDIKNNDFNKIVSDVLNGTDLLYTYIKSQSQLVADKMVLDLALGDKQVREDLLLSFKDYQSALEDQQEVDKPGEKFINSALVPKVDSSQAHLVFAKDGSVAYDEELKAAQEKLETIELPIPNGYTEEEVTALSFAYLNTRENMADSYNRSRNMPGSTLKNTESVSSGTSMMFENTFPDDGRANMHVVRTYVPAAREKAKEALEAISKGDYKDATAVVKDSFDRTVMQFRYYRDQQKTDALGAARMLVGLSKVLEKPGFKENVVITEDQKEIVKLAEAETKLAKEMAEYKAQVWKRINELRVKKDYLGDKSELDPSKDEVLQKAFVEYSARALFFDRSKVSNISYGTAAGKHFENLEEKDTAVYNQPLNRAQRNLLADPEGYIEYMKSQVNNMNYEPYKKLMEAKDFSDLEKAVKASDEASELTFNVPYIEKWEAGSYVKETIKALEGKPEYAELTKELKQLPCMTEPDNLEEISADEQMRRAKLYSSIADKIDATNLELSEKHFDESVGGMVSEEVFSASNVAHHLHRIASGLEKGVELAKKEKTFEREAVMRANAKPEKTNEQYEKAKEQYLQTEEAEYKKQFAGLETLRYGQPVAETYVEMIGKLIDNAEKNNIIDSSFAADVSALKDCLGSGTEGLEFIKAQKRLDEIESDLAQKMLDDDSDLLRQQYAFITNLMARIEGYQEAEKADSMIPEAKSQNSVYAAAYDRADYRVQKLEEAIAKADKEAKENGLENKTSAFRELMELAKKSMENLREAISKIAFGHKQEGLEVLRSGKDIATLAVYQTMVSSDEKSSLRGMLEANGAEYFVERTAKSDAIKNNCKDLDVEGLNRVLEDGRNLNEFMTNKESSDKQANGPQLHMKEPEKTAESQGPGLN